MASTEAVLLFPFSRNTADGKQSPKNYPWWSEVVRSLRVQGYVVHQVSCSGEPDVDGCAMRSKDIPFPEIKNLIRESKTWMGVDSFAQHLAWSIGKRGVAVFGPSDPLIFGHVENVNLLKDRRHLRERQFGLWSQVQWQPEIFPSPEVVIRTVLQLL